MTDNDSAQFLDLLSSMGLHQHIDFPAHISGNTLDLLISRTLNSNLIQDVRPGTYFSDHCFSTFHYKYLGTSTVEKQGIF